MLSVIFPRCGLWTGIVEVNIDLACCLYLIAALHRMKVTKLFEGFNVNIEKVVSVQQRSDPVKQFSQIEA